MAQPIVSVTIRKAGKMTKMERRRVAKWLREAAKCLIEEGEKYANVFKTNLWTLNEETD